MQFSYTPGVAGTGVISGTDKHGVTGQQFVSSRTYDHAQHLVATVNKGEQADEAIREFWAPLTDKLEALEDVDVFDPLDGTVTIKDAYEDVPGDQGLEATLDHDGVLILAVEDGHWDRLSWVNGELFVEALSPDDPAAQDELPF